MSEAQTFYGEWVDVSDDSMPELPEGSIWHVAVLEEEEEGESCSANEWEAVLSAIAWDGALYSNGEVDQVILRIRRVYPPGSVLPEPRRLLDVHPDAFRVCGLWMVRRYGHEKHSWRCMRGWLAAAGRGVDVAAAEGYPVQLLNGAPVPVPWSAVEVRNG